MEKNVDKLIIGKEEFKKKIKEIILKGNELINFSVKNKYLFGQDNEIKKNHFISEYNIWNKFNIKFLEESFDTIDNKYKEEYIKASYYGSNRTVDYGDNAERLTKNFIEQVTILKSFIEILQFISTIEEIKVETKNNMKDDMKTENKLTNKIFIVHGHKNEIKETVARTLDKLRLEPIILHEQANQGRTLIEKFEKNSSDVNFAIILLTADDEGKAKKETEYKNRARQNVVFEMGYFMGMLKRKKVFLLLENGVEKPSDLDGIVYTNIDEKGYWKYELVKELKEIGYNVSADNL